MVGRKLDPDCKLLLDSAEWILIPTFHYTPDSL